MAYCRFGDDSDVMVYRSGGLWSTHVAARPDLGAGDAAHVDTTPGDCADRLQQLRADGYLVPQSAIDRLRREQKEASGD